jgi:signal transduction histidine kinase
LPTNGIVRFREPTLWERYKWVIAAAAALCGAESILIVALLINRRRLRRAHDDLQTSEERMSLAAAAANLRFWVWDIPRDETWASATDWSLPLWDPAKPIKFDQGLRAVHVEDRDLVRQAILGAFHSDGDYKVECRIPLPDSAIRWIAARGRVEFDGKGQPIRIRGLSIDITERRRAEEEARELSGRLISAQEDERARLARALHDDITQRLALLAIEAGRSERGLADTTAKQAMRSMRGDLAQISEDVHALSYALHPAILEDLGLIEALKAECDRFSALERISVLFRQEQNLDEPPRPVALCLYRIAQEGLRNVACHASASAIEVDLRAVDPGLQLSLRDDGVGFDPTRRQARPSLGHASMRQRLSLLGGELRIDSAPGRGTTILAWVPLNRKVQRESATSVAG